MRGPMRRLVTRITTVVALSTVFVGGIGVTALSFLGSQWDPKSPWHDQRVRLAASYAIDRQAISDAETLGASIPTGSLSPREFEFVLSIEPDPYDPVKAKSYWLRPAILMALTRGTCTLVRLFSPGGRWWPIISGQWGSR